MRSCVCGDGVWVWGGGCEVNVGMENPTLVQNVYMRWVEPDSMGISVWVCVCGEVSVSGKVGSGSWSWCECGC